MPSTDPCPFLWIHVMSETSPTFRPLSTARPLYRAESELSFLSVIRKKCTHVVNKRMGKEQVKFAHDPTDLLWSQDAIR